MPPPKLDPIAIAIICVFGAVVITLAFLPLMTKTSAYTPEAARSSWAPPYDPGKLPAIKPTVTHVCLPGKLGYNGLVTCNRPTDCNSCTDNNNPEQLDCITISSNSQILDPKTNQLNPPQNVHLYRKANGVCSGRGTQKSCGDLDAPPNCTDYWCDCGTQYASANNDPTNCDVQILQVTQPGSYCLPSYVNVCNPYTSDTVLSNVGNGSQWLCECKYPDLGLFAQNSAGTDCDVPIACSAQEPQIVGDKVVKVLSYKNTDPGCVKVPGSQLTDWQFCDLYPNQLVSSNETASTPCTVPTVSTSVAVDNIYSYDAYTLSPLADPTCTVNQFSNTCTVLVGTDQGSPLSTLVMRGSGKANDPMQQRIWPPYPDLLPFNMQRCPDGWTGDGTPQNPCTDGKGFKLSYLDNQGQWNGKFLSLQDLRNVGYNSPSATPCKTPSECPSSTACTPAGICAPVCPCPAGFSCINGVCNAITDLNCVSAVGIPFTLGAIPWNTVNNSCGSAPPCLEGSTSLQQITRSLTTPSNIFPFDANIGNTACSSVSAPVCSCPMAAQKTNCKIDPDCGTGGACQTLPAFPSKTCTSDTQCNKNLGQYCDLKANVCATGLCVCSVDGSGFQCVDNKNAKCSSAVGAQRRPYDGSLDGPIVDDNNDPLGGACSCSGYIIDVNGNQIPLVPASYLSTDPALQWSCVPDPCFVAGTQSYYNPQTKRCVCGGAQNGTTYYSWNDYNGLPSCQRDTCNNNGFNSPIQVNCGSNEDCYTQNVLCSNKKCYVKSTTTCDPTTGTVQCAGVEGGLGKDSVQCLEDDDGKYYCAVIDPTRPSCNQASDCALGICDSNSNLCTGGCVCHNATDPFFTEVNPLHSACTDPCIFNPCGANGTCSANQDGSYKCTCNEGFAGDSCENRICKAYEAPCVHDVECCSNNCEIKFQWDYPLLSYRCQAPANDS